MYVKEKKDTIGGKSEQLTVTSEQKEAENDLFSLPNARKSTKKGKFSDFCF